MGQTKTLYLVPCLRLTSLLISVYVSNTHISDSNINLLLEAGVAHKLAPYLMNEALGVLSLDVF